MIRTALILVAASCSLTATPISASDSGWFASSGQSAINFSSGFENYAVGYDNGDFSPGQTLSDFFVFDLTSVTGDITSATLDLYVPTGGVDGGPGYQSPNSSEEYLLTGTSSSIADLTGSYGPGDTMGQGVYGSLGTGTTYADISIDSADQGTTVEIALNAAGLAFLNANEGSEVALSGRNPNVVPADGLDLFFTYTNPGSTSSAPFPQTPTPTLSIATTPEPASPALVFAGLAAMFAGLRRRRRSPAPIH
jgi:hypothetical protein